MRPQAALIADLAATRVKPDIPDNAEARIERISRDPLAIFRMLHGQPRQSAEPPGPEAAIRGKIASALIEDAAPAAVKPEPRRRTGKIGAARNKPPDVAAPFVPSPEDIVAALDVGGMRRIPIWPLAIAGIAATSLALWLLR